MIDARHTEQTKASYAENGCLFKQKKILTTVGEKIGAGKNLQILNLDRNIGSLSKIINIPTTHNTMPVVSICA